MGIKKKQQILFPTLTTSTKMCGIVGIFGSEKPSDELRKQIIEMGKKIRHRGPDWSGVKMIHQGAIAHERLAIVDPESGEQPLCHLISASDSSSSSELTLAVNGEIYNHLELREHLTVDYTFKTKSDCECIMPLYIGWGSDGGVHIASELKAINEHCVRFQCFPPGHMYSSKDNKFVQWYNPIWHDEDLIPTSDAHLSLTDLRQAFTDSVERG